MTGFGEQTSGRRPHHFALPMGTLVLVLGMQEVAAAGLLGPATALPAPLLMAETRGRELRPRAVPVGSQTPDRRAQQQAASQLMELDHLGLRLEIRPGRSLWWTGEIGGLPG